MKTDDLIDALARNAEPERPASPPGRIARSLAVGLGAGALLLLAFVRVRADFGDAIVPVLLKAALSAAAAAAALPALTRLSRPGRPLGARLTGALGFLGLCVALGAILAFGHDPAERFQAWMGGGFPWCVVIIPALAAPIAVTLTLLLRDMAPTRLRAAGAAIGATAGGLGAMLYAMHCPVDSAAFVMTWYAVAISICAALGAIIAARFLRW